MDRLISAAIVLAAGASIPAEAAANGLSTHVWISLRARELVEPGPLFDFINDPHVQDALVAGTAFPDGGYAVGHAYGELAHWEPLQVAYREWIQNNYQPPYEGEAALHVAFFLGMYSHGMADQVFDSLYLERAKIYDADSNWTEQSADEATDVVFCGTQGAQPNPQHFVPAAAFVEVLASNNQITIDEATLERGESLAGFAVAIVGMLAADREAVAKYEKQFPWATAHLFDPKIPGRPEHEAVMVARYWKKAWTELHAENFANLVLGTVPENGAFEHATDHTSIEARVSVIFADRQNDAEVRPERFRVAGQSGVEIPVDTDLYYGTDSHVVHLIPRENFAENEDYEVTVDGNFRFGFSTRAAPVSEEKDGCVCVRSQGSASTAWALALCFALIVSRSGLRRR
jgi:hypothetical protein